MQCFGLGGSSKDGAATGAWCRIQRDLYALHLSDRLADVGALEQAAIVYCSRRLHWKDMHGYDSKEACNSAYWAILEAQHDEVTNVRDRTTQLMLDEVVRDVNDHTSSEVERGTRRVVNKVEECSGCAGGKMGAAYDG